MLSALTGNFVVICLVFYCIAINGCQYLHKDNFLLIELVLIGGICGYKWPFGSAELSGIWDFLNLKVSFLCLLRELLLPEKQLYFNKTLKKTARSYE